MISWIIAAMLLSTPLDAAFETGVQAYEDGDVGAAATSFETVLAQEPDAATLYNYGNALARSDRWVEALAAYRSAQRRRPRDRDIGHNVDLVLDKLGQRRPSLFSTAGASVRAPEVFLLLVALSCLWAGLAIYLGFTQRRWALRALWGLSAAIVLAATLFAFRSYDEMQPRAIGLMNTSAQSDPSARAASLFAIPPGTEVQVGLTRTEWTRVRLQRQWVWVRTGSLQKLW